MVDMNVSFSNNLTRTDRGQTNIGSVSTTQDNVLDLTQESTLQEELQSTTTSDIRFVRVAGENGEDVFLSLDSLQPAEREALIGELKSRILNESGEVRQNFTFEGFITATETSLRIGNNTSGQSSQAQLAPIDQANSVIQRSNQNPDDATWDFANGGATTLNASDPSNKPAAWYNHMWVAGDRAFVYQTNSDTRQTALPNEQTVTLTRQEAQQLGLPQELMQQFGSSNTAEFRTIPLDDYRTMLQSDFNFNDAFSEFQSADGFYQALAATYPERVAAFGEENFRELSDRLYSYATTGMDTDGSTRVDEMQGMIFALDPEIRMSSNSNTPMQAQELFKISAGDYAALSPTQQGNYALSKDGSYVPLSIGADQYGSLSSDDQAKFLQVGDRYVPRGDNRHGRATILSTRHIMERAIQNIPSQEPIEIGIQDGWTHMFNENDRFIRDHSGSLSGKWGVIKPGIAEHLTAQGLATTVVDLDNRMDAHIQQEGEIHLTSKNTTRVQTTDALVAGQDVTWGERNDFTEDFSNVIETAYATLYPENTQANKEQFAQLLGVDVSTILDRNGNIDGEKVMEILGDTSASRGNRSIGATGESGFKGIITTLLLDPDYQGENPPRMNVLLDEPVQDMEYLELAKALASARDVDVRVIAMPTNLTDNTPTSQQVLRKDFEASPGEYMAFVDLNSMQVNRTGENPTSLTFTSTTFDADGHAHTSEQTQNFQWYQGRVGVNSESYNVNFSQNDGFKGSYVPLLYQGNVALQVIEAGTE